MQKAISFNTQTTLNLKKQKFNIMVTSKIIKKLKIVKKYYFKVQAYTTINGQKVSTKFGKAKSVKVK